MRILSISYENYRCFVEGHVKFEEFNSDKHLDLFVGANGAGKTEFLFSLWWVLYPETLDFKDMRGKENTPYSLNQNLYNEFLEGKVNNAYCSVEVNILNEGITHTITRTEYFSKNHSKIESSLEVEYYEVDSNGNTSLPINNNDIVQKKIQKIIPKQVLSGLIFDGERMKKISNLDEKSIESIEGVISDISNKELLLEFENELIKVEDEFQKKMKKISIKKNSQLLYDITNKLSSDKIDVIKLNKEREKLIKNIQETEKGLDEISLILKNSEETREIQQKIERTTIILNEKKILFDKQNEDLKNLLSLKGPNILIEKLINNVGEIIDNSNIPFGLNVEIANNILMKNSCVCGIEFNDEMKNYIKELIKELPPNNFNATLKEMARNLVTTKTSSMDNLNDTYSNVNQLLVEVNNLEKELISLKMNLNTNFDKKEINTLIKESEKKSSFLLQNKKELEMNEKELNKLEENIKENNKLQKLYSKSIDEAKVTQRKLEYILLCKKALEEISEKHKMEALLEINYYFQRAFKDLSEDYSLGRRAYITQFGEKKYKMLVYYEKDVETYIKNHRNYIMEKLNLENIKEEHIFEFAIIANSIPNSTGQGKILSLAFVKAILEYSKSNNSKENEIRKVKAYPLIIDAPFSDISGENLKNAANLISSFADQVILLISPDNFKDIEKLINKNINTKYNLEKSNDKNSARLVEANK